MAVDDVWQLQELQLYAGQQIMNSFAFRSKSATVITPAIALALANAWKEPFRLLQVNTLSYRGWVLQQLRGGTAAYVSGTCRRDGGLRLEGAHTGTLIGANAGVGLPPQSAVVTTIKSGFSGRRRRGRHYMAGMDVVNENAGTITSAMVGYMAAAWAGLMAAYGPGGTNPDFQLGIWSGRTATGCAPAVQHPHHLTQLDPPDPAAAFLNCDSVQVRNIVYSQRRRTIGVGR